jgi:hypothetical protein
MVREFGDGVTDSVLRYLPEMPLGSHFAHD